MKVFCDTSIFVAAFSHRHDQYESARRVLERVHSGLDQGIVSAHSLAETYAVLTRLPGTLRVEPNDVWRQMEKNVLGHFSVITLTAKEYTDTLRRLAENKIPGGQTYDAILLKAAEKSGAERILTFNVRHFQALAPPSLAARIFAPN